MENKSFSTTFRVMHWLIAITIFFLLLTIFLRLTFLNKENVATIIQSFFLDNQLEITKDNAILLAKSIRKPMWDIHIYLGYILVFLFSLRFSFHFLNIMKIQNPFSKNISLKVKFQFWVYIIFYFCIVISLITGLLIEFGDPKYKDFIEDIHKLSIYYLVLYIFTHLSGVFLAEFTTQKRIISEVISGKK